MKKFFSMFSLVMAVMCVSFVSCGSDDDNTEDPIVETPVYSSVKAKFSFELSEATIKVAKATVSYTDEEGKTATETVSNGKWEKNVTINKPISECGFQVFISKVGELDEKSRLGFESMAISVESYDQKGSLRSKYANENAETAGVEPEDLDKYFELCADSPLAEMTVAIDKNGNCTEKK